MTDDIDEETRAIIEALRPVAARLAIVYGRPAVARALELLAAIEREGTEVE